MALSNKKVDITHWLFFIILIFCLKLFIFYIDPLPMFFLGDSHSYITTSLTAWIPLDRSFVYGFVIKFIAVPAHSLTPLIAVQSFTSGLNAVFISYVLINFFSLRPGLAFSLGLLCALEPLQLMYERYIMTESLALFLFALYIVFSFHYLKRPRLIFLALIQIVGTGLISFRLSFLPIVMINTVLLPVLIVPVIRNKYSLELHSMRQFFQNLASYQPIMKTVALHVIVAIGLTYSLHAGYKILNGYLSHKPAAYQYQTGNFLLAYWGPVVKPIDFPIPDLTEQVFRDLKYDLKNPHQRAGNHWAPGGLLAHLNEAIPDVLYADHVAKETALNAIKRDPIGIASLALSGFLDYWNLNILPGNMKNDRGDRPIPENLLELLRNSFNLYADHLPFVKTFTNRYFFIAWPWYLFLLCLPFLTLAVLFICSDKIWRYMFLVLIAVSEIVFVACLMIEGPTVRYLHALGWLSFIVIGPLLDHIFVARENKGY